jgi:hypothetical protein
MRLGADDAPDQTEGELRVVSIEAGRLGFGPDRVLGSQ